MSETDPHVVTQYERETWNRCADSYLDTFAALTGETVPLLIEAAEIRAGTKVLELGSGPGHVADSLVRAGAVVTGVDFAADMVEVAQRRFPQVTFLEADAEQLPIDDCSFDAVVANLVVHHLARPGVVFQEANRILQPGGRFAFVVFGDPREQSSIAAFFAAVEEHHSIDDLPHGPLFGVTDRQVYEPLFTGAGFPELRLDVHKITWRSETLEPVIRGFWDWGNMSALPKKVQDRILASTRENAEPYRCDGGYAFPHTALVGAARKP